jgi:hypothetical protein
VEHLRRSSEAQAEADGDRELQQLDIGEMRSQPLPQLVVDGRVVDRKQLRVFCREPFTRGELGPRMILLDVLVELVVESLPYRRCGPGVQSNIALVELRDPHTRDFSFADGKARPFVHCPHHCGHPLCQVRRELPDASRFAPVSGRDVDSCHRPSKHRFVRRVTINYHCLLNG